MHIPHNKIYRIHLEKRKIMKNQKKRKRRKYVRFGREHSMSLWQGDCKMLEDRRWLVAFMDIDELIDWYNHEKPYMSLEFDNTETPEEALW